MDKKLVSKIKKTLKLSSLEIASTPWQLMLGLMFRKSMPRKHGLLFDFHFSDRQGIWMLFMRFPIDIHFLDSKGNKVEIIKNMQPLRLFKPSTWKIYRPKKPCRYAVEVSRSCM